MPSGIRTARPRNGQSPVCVTGAYTVGTGAPRRPNIFVSPATPITRKVRALSRPRVIDPPTGLRAPKMRRATEDEMIATRSDDASSLAAKSRPASSGMPIDAR